MSWLSAAAGGGRRIVLSAIPEIARRASAYSDAMSEAGPPPTITKFTGAEATPATGLMELGHRIMTSGRVAANDRYAREQLRQEQQKGNLSLSLLQRQIATEQARQIEAARTEKVPVGKGFVMMTPPERARWEIGEHTRRQQRMVEWMGGFDLDAGEYDKEALREYIRAWVAKNRPTSRGRGAGGAGGIAKSPDIQRALDEVKAAMDSRAERESAVFDAKVMQPLLARLTSDNKAERRAAAYQLLGSGQVAETIASSPPEPGTSNFELHQQIITNALGALRIKAKERAMERMKKLPSSKGGYADVLQVLRQSLLNVAGIQGGPEDFGGGYDLGRPGNEYIEEDGGYQEGWGPKSEEPAEEGMPGGEPDYNAPAIEPVAPILGPKIDNLLKRVRERGGGGR